MPGDDMWFQAAQPLKFALKAWLLRVFPVSDGLKIANLLIARKI